ncbi:MAG: hypothetical protein IJQ44_08335 [Bacteroidaceae bacterium]|nr:hypothetical protein [Bacteroidaceae bacterium]
MAYHILVPQSLIESRHVFPDNPKLPDGRTVLSVRDLSYTRFSYGPVEIVNDQDLAELMNEQVSND